MRVSMLSGDLNVFEITKVETHIKKIREKKKKTKKEVHCHQTRHTSLRLAKDDDSSVWS